jgi:proteasome lid subunit RPN8/RPN11
VPSTTVILSVSQLALRLILIMFGHRLIGWIHTHPSFTADPSNTDDATMRAQVCSLGRPLLCCIEGTDGLRAHWYVDDESNPIEYKVARVRRKLFGLIPNKELAGRNDGNEEVCA